MAWKLKKLLVIDDDPLLPESVRSALASTGYGIDVATHLEAGLRLLSSQPYALVISEIHVLCQNKNGLKAFRELHPNQRVLFIADAEAIAVAELSEDLKNEQLLARNVVHERLPALAAEVLGELPIATLDEMTFARLATESFMCGTTFPCDVYIQLKSGGFLKAAEVGETYSPDFATQLVAEGFRELWVSKEDFDSYLQLSQKAFKLLQSPAIDINRRARIIRHACEVAVENLRLCGVSNESMGLAVNTLVSSLSAISAHDTATAMLEEIEMQGPPVYTHAVTCGIICGLLPRVMGWFSEKNVLILTLGGCLHDVGLLRLPTALQNLDPQDMGEKDLAAYLKHPEVGAELLQGIPGIPPEVVLITLQHHENGRGTGFPNKLSASETFPMSRIVSLVDVFCDRLLKLPPAERSQAPKVLHDLVSDGSAYEVSATHALWLLLTEPDPMRARLGFESWVARRPRAI